MRALLQRVLRAEVSVDGRTTGKIEKGLLVLLGVMEGDTEAEAHYLADRICGLRIFEDSEGKMNLSLRDVKGELLVISQFTLFANTRKGNRPSFIDAVLPETSKAFYLDFIQALRDMDFKVEEGEFGADMAVELVNDGPVTIIMDSKNR